jgi:hypothetical protein
MPPLSREIEGYWLSESPQCSLSAYRNQNIDDQGVGIPQRIYVNQFYATVTP